MGHKTWNLKERLGFTLIEVIMVLALLGSATALAAPNVMEALDGSKDKADASQMDFLLSAFQTQQAPFFDEHNNPYDLLKNDNIELIKDADGNTIGSQMKAGAAVATLDLFLQDAILDPTSEVYIEGVQCVTTEQSEKDGKPIFKAAESAGKLYIVCTSGDGNRSNAEMTIPGVDHEDHDYSAGEGIRWGDSLLYIGDYENLESRFVGGSCQDYQMEAGFYFDNHIHQAGDHKSHMGIVFNYIDDNNFCLLDLQLKNGTKQMDAYQVVNGTWSELENNINIGQDYNLPGNNDYVDGIQFSTRLTVWNSVEGTSTVKFEMAQVGVNGGSYDEVFTKDFSISEGQKSSRYAFYIGEPDGNQIKQDGVIIGYKDLDSGPVDYDDPTTFEYEDVQIQLLSYPSFICESEDGSFGDGDSGSGSETPADISVTSVDFSSTGVTAHFSRSLQTNEEVQYQFYKDNGGTWSWDTDATFGNNTDETKVNIQILRDGSLAYGPWSFETTSTSTNYGSPSFTYNYNSANTPITINSSDSGSFDIAYLWVDGIGNSTAPSDSASPDDSTGMSQVSPAGYGSDSGWLWARDYDEDGHGDWTGTPWVGSGDFSSDDLKGVLNNSNYEVYYDGSFSGMTIQYYGGTNSSWQSSRPTISSSSDTVRARVAYGSLQVSQEIQKNGFDVPESPVNPFSITCTLSYSTSQGWVLMLASDKVYSYSVMAYDVEKNNLEASVSANDITGTRSINLAKKSDRYELTITDSEGNVYTRNENLTEKSYILP